jgi:hypothetical protein
LRNSLITPGRTYRAWVCFLQDFQRPLDDLLPGRSDPRQVAALADEDLESELILEQLDLLADPGLRRMQLLGGRRDVQAALGHRGQVP